MCLLIELGQVVNGYESVVIVVVIHLMPYMVLNGVVIGVVSNVPLVSLVLVLVLVTRRWRWSMAI